MYLCNKYYRWYNNIIASALERVNHVGYYEKHHIIPRSLGGSNDPTNIVKLTAKEHFVCHMLLPKMTTGDNKSKMIRAAWMIATMGNRNHMRIKVKSRRYCQLKEQWLQHGNLNQPKSEQHKQNLRKPKPEGFGKKVSEYRTGKSWGHKHTDETKQKMSEWQKGTPKEKIRCEHCGKEVSQLNYKKWHGKHCTHNPQQEPYLPPEMNSIFNFCEHCKKEFNKGNFARWHGDNCKLKP